MRNWVINQLLAGIHGHEQKQKRGNLTSAQLDDGRAAHLRVKHLQNYIYFIVQAASIGGKKGAQIAISFPELFPRVH